MGGGSSSNWQENKIESVKLFGGEYRDCHIFKEISLVEKNLTINECEKLLIKQGIEGEQFKILVPKIKFSAIGSIENVQFLIEKSVFSGKYIQISFQKVTPQRHNLSINISKIMAVYNIPIELRKQIQADYSDGRCYRYDAREYQAIKGLPIDKQADIISKVKEKIELYKSRKWSGAGKLTILDVIQQQFFQKNMWFPDGLLQIYPFIRQDFLFLLYLQNNKWKNVSEFIKAFYLDQEYYKGNPASCYILWIDKITFSMFNDIANQLFDFPFKNQIQSITIKQQLKPNVKYENANQYREDVKLMQNLWSILPAIVKNPNCMNALKRQKVNQFDWNGIQYSQTLLGKIVGQYKKRQL